MIVLLVIAVIILFDLGIKGVIENEEDSAFPKDVEGTGGFLVLRKCHNPGLPMGFLANHPQLVLQIPVIVTSAAAGILVCFLPQKGCRPQKLGLAMILGGSLSNLYDRFVRGYVVDYLSIRWKGLQKIIFNLSDVCILAGAVLYMAGELLTGVREKRLGGK